MTVDDLITEIVGREGGWVDDPLDRGSATNHGVTRATLAAWRGHHVTIADVKALTVDEARAIYATQYIDAPGFRHVPEPLRTQVVDFGVTSGQMRAAKLLQRLVGVAQDGVIGSRTDAAIARQDVKDLTRRYWQERVRFYAWIPVRDGTQSKFLNGWLNRCFGMQP